MSCVKNITQDMQEGGLVLHVLREEYHAGYAGKDPVLHVLREEYHAGYAGRGACPVYPA